MRRRRTDWRFVGNDPSVNGWLACRGDAAAVTRSATLPSLSRSPSGARAAPPGRYAPFALLAVATLCLAILQGAPRPGLPTMLLFPPGMDADGAILRVLAVPGWDLVSVRRLGPVTIAVAAPAIPDADSSTLRRDAGAWLGVLALGRGGCAGLSFSPPP